MQRARRAMANQRAGKAASDSPTLKPYPGKPAVRNFRGDGGNAGIIEARLAPPSYSTRDNITRTGARAPGVERLEPLARRCLYVDRSPTQSGEYSIVAESTKGDGKPGTGKAASDIPALKPD
jgi:hypothetical protein